MLSLPNGAFGSVERDELVLLVADKCQAIRRNLSYLEHIKPPMCRVSSHLSSANGRRHPQTSTQSRRSGSITTYSSWPAGSGLSGTALTRALRLPRLRRSTEGGNGMGERPHVSTVCARRGAIQECKSLKTAQIRWWSNANANAHGLNFSQSVSIVKWTGTLRTPTCTSVTGRPAR